MSLRPLRSSADHAAALNQIDLLRDAEPGTFRGDRLEILTILVETYEARRWPRDLGDPLAAIAFAMDRGGYTQSDLARVLGSRQRASDLLARRRRLTLPMIWRLVQAWKIPAEALIAPYGLGPPEAKRSPARSSRRSAARRAA